MVQSWNAAREFGQAVKGKNLMTPDIVNYYYAGDYAVELSKGRGFDGQPIYGVTVVKDGEHNHELSKLCHSKAEAENYIRELGK